MAHDRRTARKHPGPRSRSVVLLGDALSVECSGRHAAGWWRRERPSQCPRNVARRHTYRELLQLFALPDEHSEPLGAAKECIVLPLIVAGTWLTACLFIWGLGGD